MFLNGPPYHRFMNRKFQPFQFVIGLSGALAWGGIMHLVAHQSHQPPQASQAPTTRERHGSVVQRVDVHGNVRCTTIYQQPGEHGAAVVWIEEQPST